MIKEQVDKYFNNFRRELGGYLIPNIGITISIYPYLSGMVGVVEFDEEASMTFYKSESSSLIEAITKTAKINFDDPNIEVNGTSIRLLRSCIVIIKNDDAAQYNEQSVLKDVKQIITEISHEQ